jgi:nicotinate-nucleotide pyrophosphorylase (carboxylating)
MPRPDLDDLIDRAIAEDIGDGDMTTAAVVPGERRALADVIVNEPGVVSGLDAALAAVRRLDPAARLDVLIDEGAPVHEPPCTVARIDASAQAILGAERTALNFLQRLSGIATTTRAYVEAVAGTGVEILDTRKTAPGMRELDKRAVRCGGGLNHRMGLDDGILIKDNHVAIAGGVRPAVEAARRARPDLEIEVEADTLDQLEEAMAAGADVVLLDNMDPATLRQAVGRARAFEERNGRRPRLEASGGITLDTVRDVAGTGVDAISVGALTHSVRALDVSLEVHP